MSTSLLNPVLSPRQACGRAAFLGTAALAVALTMQAQLGLEPCPLCILQRYCLLALIGLCLVGRFGPVGASRWLGAAGTVAAMAGVGFALRHVYLQMFPPVVSVCGPGFEYIVDAFPLKDALPMLFKGTGDCSKIDWEWGGFTLPRLSLIIFGALVFILTPPLLRRK